MGKTIYEKIKAKKDSLYFNWVILENKPNLLVCGHSHILKIARDEKYNLIYINPGAVGKVGFHKEKTMVRFNLVDDKIEDMQVIKLDG